MNKLILICFVLFSCTQKVVEKNQTTAETPSSEWVENATIYEVNLRAFSKQGNFISFTQALPKLKELGIGAICVEPFHPLAKSIINASSPQAESLAEDHHLSGSYLIKNYTATEETLGTLEDFKTLVETAHKLGIKVILEWEANHTARDHKWVKKHPDWYTKDSLGKIVHPKNTSGKIEEWKNGAQLNFNNYEMRLAMIKSMEYWLKEFDIDGYKCNTSDDIPLDFWVNAAKELKKTKPIIMLAKGIQKEYLEYKNCFDAYYAVDMLPMYQNLYTQEIKTAEFISLINQQNSNNKSSVSPVNFIANLDTKNNGASIQNRLGSSWRANALLYYAIPGIPAIVSGQEFGLNHTLRTFDKDSLPWNEPNSKAYFNFYKKLNTLKKQKELAINSPITFDEEYENKNLLIINRGKENQVRIILNLSPRPWPIIGHEIDITGGYTITDSYLLKDSTLNAWGYTILTKK